MEYQIILEEGEETWGAWVPELPGCVALGATREQALAMICETVVSHLEELEQDAALVELKIAADQRTHILVAGA